MDSRGSVYVQSRLPLGGSPTYLSALRKCFLFGPSYTVSLPAGSVTVPLPLTNSKALDSKGSLILLGEYPHQAAARVLKPNGRHATVTLVQS